MKREAPIGVFDSGIGGLTVAHAIAESMPNESLIYFGDTAHLPYGDKSVAAIQAFSIKICNVLLSHGCKAIVIACNSASSAAYDLVKEYVASRALVINVIDPMVAHVSEHFEGKNVGLIGTKRTVQSNTYLAKVDALQQNIHLKSLATPLLVPVIEEGFYNNSISDQVIKAYLDDQELAEIEALILGCTHYPLIKEHIERYYQESVAVLDSSTMVAEALKKALNEADLTRDEAASAHQFYVSDYTHAFQASAEMFFGEAVDLKPYKLWE